MTKTFAIVAPYSLHCSAAIALFCCVLCSRMDYPYLCHIYIAMSLYNIKPWNHYYTVNHYHICLTIDFVQYPCPYQWLPVQWRMLQTSTLYWSTAKLPLCPHMNTKWSLQWQHNNICLLFENILYSYHIIHFIATFIATDTDTITNRKGSTHL